MLLVMPSWKRTWLRSDFAKWFIIYRFFFFVSRVLKQEETTKHYFGCAPFDGSLKGIRKKATALLAAKSKFMWQYLNKINPSLWLFISFSIGFYRVAVFFPFRKRAGKYFIEFRLNGHLLVYAGWNCGWFRQTCKPAVKCLQLPIRAVQV